MVQTQWRVGAIGFTGLDYQGVESLVRMRRLARGKDLAACIADLQIMEAAALAEWARQREQREQRNRRNQR